MLQVLSMSTGVGSPRRITRVYVVRIAHSPAMPSDAEVELPLSTRARLGLDGERSLVGVSEVNRFSWPYGFSLPGIFRIIRDRFVARAREKAAKLVARTE